MMWVACLFLKKVDTSLLKNVLRLLRLLRYAASHNCAACYASQNKTRKFHRMSGGISLYITQQNLFVSRGNLNVVFGLFGGVFPMRSLAETSVA